MMPTKQIDLNADLGEHPGVNLDKQIMPYLSSCNVACGGHVGDEHSIRSTLMLAKEYGVSIGAHPSFPDKENFGRVVMEISSASLRESLFQQIQLVRSVSEELGTTLNHVKPHGALYNLAARDKATSILIGKVIKSIDPGLKWMGLAGSISQKVSEDLKVPFIAEAFADRRYEPNGALMSRQKEGAVITEEAELIQQVEEIALRRRVFSEKWITLQPDSICLHGDTEGAVNLARKIHDHLVSKGVSIHSIQ